MSQIYNNRNKNSRGLDQSQKEKDLKINKRITAPEVRLLGREGEQLGIVPLKDAIDMVCKIIKNENIEMDLVEISANATPPVCRIMNYSKYLYEKNKKEKINKKQSKAVKLKEVVIKPAIEKHDFDHKCRHARSFLEKGDKVKIMLKMRGREIQHAKDNIKTIEAFIENLQDVSKIEQQIKQDRFIISAILSSNVNT